MTKIIDIKLIVSQNLMLKQNALEVWKEEKMRVHMVNPPYCVGEDGLGVLPAKAMLPNGALMVASLLRGKGCHVNVTDLVFRQNWKNYLPEHQFDVVLMSCHTTRNVISCIAVLSELRKRQGVRSRVVLGGNACLDLGIEQFSKLGLEVDAVVRGWSHAPDVIEQVMSGYKGDIWSQEPIQLTLPAVDLLSEDVQTMYLESSEGKYPMYAFGIGCLWSCGYCNSYMKSAWTIRPIEDALREVELARKLGYRKIWCVDNLLFTDPEVSLHFDSALTAKEMKWSGMTRSELVCKLPEIYFRRFTSLTEVAMGVETVSESLLKALNRGVKKGYRQTLAEAFRRINKSGRTKTNAFVILDIPGSTEADFWQLYKLLKTVNPGTVSWSFYNPPAKAVLDRTRRPEDMGFYRWPLGYSQERQYRIVQQAMILSGTWWDKWTPNLVDPFFETETAFGVNFLEGRIVQEKSARDATGDIWHVWKKGRRKP